MNLEFSYMQPYTIPMVYLIDVPMVHYNLPTLPLYITYGIPYRWYVPMVLNNFPTLPLYITYGIPNRWDVPMVLSNLPTLPIYLTYLILIPYLPFPYALTYTMPLPTYHYIIDLTLWYDSIRAYFILLTYTVH